MVDCRAFARFNAEFAFTVTPDDCGDKDDGDNQDIEDNGDNKDIHGYNRPDRKLPTPTTLTDIQCLIATPTVCGFSFREKAWLHLFVDNLSPVVWDNDAFPRLVLPTRHKKIGRAHV